MIVAGGIGGCTGGKVHCQGKFLSDLLSDISEEYDLIFKFPRFCSFVANGTQLGEQRIET